MQIIEVELSKLKDYENNPRNNEEAIESVANSIKEFGFKVPIIIDQNFIIVAGHTRKKAAQVLQLNKVPCIVAEDLTEDQIKAFRLADNKTAELATWDFTKLEEELANINIDMLAFGFNEDDFNIDPGEATEDDFNIDDAIEEIEEPTAQPGDVWQLGRHRLICGDSTDQKTILKLMDGATADIVLTDPPYNVAISNSQGMTIQNDNMSNSDFKAFINGAMKCTSEVLKEGGAFYVWFGDCEDVNFRNACNDNKLMVKQCLIWVKNNFNLGRQDYQWSHEPCLYGWKDGAAHYFIDDRTQGTVIEDKPNLNKMNKDQLKDYIKEILQDKEATTIMREDKPLKNTDHPTMKPIKLIARQIRNSSKQNEIVLDIFGGSGSTLIAAEQLNRVCYMCELDPKYCDVIIKRWETLTGKQAQLLNKAV